MSFYPFVALSNTHINGGVVSLIFVLLSSINNHIYSDRHILIHGLDNMKSNGHKI